MRSSIKMMKSIKAFVVFVCLIIVSKINLAQTPKEDNTALTKIKNDINTFCSALFEGRLTGSKGDSLTANYIESRFKQIAISPYKGRYQWDYFFKGSAKVGSGAFFNVQYKPLNIGNEVIILPFGKGVTISGKVLPYVDEPNNIWMIPCSKLNLRSTNEPQKLLYEYAKRCENNSVTAIVFFNDIAEDLDMEANTSMPYESVTMPVVYINHKAYLTFVKPYMKKDWIDIYAKLGYENTTINTQNIIGYIDNKALYNIVIAAHYDHLGNMGVLYKGADNNASGVAGLLSLAEMIKAYGLKRYNYIFVTHSGYETDMQGIKSFLKQNEFILSNIACFVNLNMIGRFNNVQQDIYLSGIGTSPVWMPAILKSNKNYKLHIDSTGTGWGAYRLFYAKEIPVLNISTGYHDDYMRATDDEKKINIQGIADIASFTYRIIAEIDKQNKPLCTKVQDEYGKIAALKSDLGIIHDFSYDQNGCKVACTLPGSKAAKAGILSGDVIVKMGTFNIIDTDDYVDAIKKSTIGKEITIMVKRNNTEFKFFITL